MSASVLYALTLALALVALTAMVMVLRELRAIHHESLRLKQVRHRYLEALRARGER
jgi:hypothetical protein